MASVANISAANRPDRSEPISLPIRGGATAPRRARIAVVSSLDPDLTEEQRSDTALIVSELVTNSVVHANIGSDRILKVDVARHEDRLLIAVTDRGSQLEPHLPPHTDGRRDHWGLSLVSEMSAAWGVERDPIGTTRVWCELPLAPPPTARGGSS